MTMINDDVLANALREHIKVFEQTCLTQGPSIAEISKVILQCFERGNKLMLCGNGGSVADPQHIAAEIINRFRFDRPPLPALAWTTDPSVVTSIGNDSDFACIFRDKWKPLRSLAICSQPSVPADALPMC